MHHIHYLNELLDKAANRVVKDLLDAGGIGGVIALDNNGHGK
jgi:isoaspartyl peptidase/L-asparaginase-like protein (Ntn-hydrolase superfamily)